jgi:hypothetical protein
MVVVVEEAKGAPWADFSNRKHGLSGRSITDLINELELERNRSKSTPNGAERRTKDRSLK